MARPTKYQIAEYWHSPDRDQRLGFSFGHFVIDVGEPSCFACHRWGEGWDKPVEIAARWEKARLQRCHIVAKSLGGADQADNFVLMCARCHRAAPDHADERYLFRWMEARPAEVATEVIREISKFEVNLDDLMEWVNKNKLKTFLPALEGQRVSLHSGELKPSTFAAAVVSAYKQVAGERR